ncbi:MAG: enoyl-CoA hydratase/isomerase family protein [Pyrinomonadaceae bacterium]
MTSEPTIVAETRGAVSVIRLNNPKQKNALSGEVLDTLDRTIKELSCRPEMAVIIFTGSAAVFASGANINELRQLTPSAANEFALRGQQVFQSIVEAKPLTIAAINGHCVGGGLDFALACDLRFASAGALFRHPGATLGIVTGWGGTQRLPRLIGVAPAVELFITAKSISSQEALRLGLVTRIADPVLEYALEFACELAESREAKP